MGVFTTITLKEILHKKLFLITVFVTIIYLCLYCITLQYAQNALVTMENPVVKAVLIPQILTAGLYFGSLLTAVFAIFATVSVLSGEIESGVMHTVVSGSVTRAQIVLGKFLGLSLIGIIYAALLFCGVTLAVQSITGNTVESYFTALCTFSLLPVFLVSITMAGSALLPTTANGIIIFTLYALSLIGGVVEQIATITENEVLLNMGILSSLMMPADSIYRKVTSLVVDSANNPLAGLVMLGPFGSQTEPSALMMSYTVVYLFAALFLAVLIFQRRDI